MRWDGSDTFALRNCTLQSPIRHLITFVQNSDGKVKNQRFLFVFTSTDGSVKEKPSWRVLVACALRHLTSTDERAASIIFDQGDHVHLLKFLNLPRGEKDETMVYFTVFLASKKVCLATFTDYRMCSLTIYALVARWARH